MRAEKAVSQHYQHPDLVEAIASALEKQGKSIANIRTRDLASVDEFHMGGPVATEHFFKALKLSSNVQVIDLGCGIGGSARFCAQFYGCHVTGIDLTESYIQAARTLTDWVGLTHQINFNQGSVLALEVGEAQFDCAYMMHLGMNIEDKTQLFKEAARVLNTHSALAIYDILRVGQGELSYPMPWSSANANSHLATIDVYRQALDSAGFDVEIVNNRQEFAKDFYRKMSQSTQPKPLGLHILMQQDAATKIANMVSGLTENIIAPFEIYARKR